MTNVTLFSQIISKIDRNIFYRVVTKHNSDKYNKGISSWNHLVSMLFCQFAKAESLRDISNGLHGFVKNIFEEGFVITEQKGHVFKGYKTYVNKNDQKQYTENFSGSVSGCGDIVIAEHEDGILLGTMRNKNSIILQYAENGDIPKAQYIELERVVKE